MVKAGAILLVLGILVMALGGAYFWRHAPKSEAEAQKMFGMGEAKRVGDDGRVSLEVVAGEKYVLELTGRLQGNLPTPPRSVSPTPREKDGADSTAVKLPLTIGVYDAQGERLNQEESPRALISADDQTFTISLSFTAPASGNVEVRIQKAAPTAKAMGAGDMKLRMYSEAQAKQAMTGMAGKFAGGGAAVCCVGPVLGILGLILLIIGLVRRGRRREQDTNNLGLPPTPRA